jgi:hypothetical protein
VQRRFAHCDDEAPADSTTMKVYVGSLMQEKRAANSGAAKMLTDAKIVLLGVTMLKRHSMPAKVLNNSILASCGPVAQMDG